MRKTFTGDINTTIYFNKYYTKAENARGTIITKVIIYYEDLFFATIAIKNIKLTANNERCALITSTSAYLIILEIDYN